MLLNHRNRDPRELGAAEEGFRPYYTSALGSSADATAVLVEAQRES